jgi:hypothetical protein
VTLRSSCNQFRKAGASQRCAQACGSKEEGLSFPFPAVETAGYYQSSPAGTGLASSVWEEFPDAALVGRNTLGVLPLSLAPMRSRGFGQDDRVEGFEEKKASPR